MLNGGTDPFIFVHIPSIQWRTVATGIPTLHWDAAAAAKATFSKCNKCIGYSFVFQKV